MHHASFHKDFECVVDGGLGECWNFLMEGYINLFDGGMGIVSR